MKNKLENDKYFTLKGVFEDFDYPESDQRKGFQRPQVEKTVSDKEKLIPLIPIEKISLKNIDIKKCFSIRKSSRKFSEEKISLEELSFLLWSAQGVRQELKNDKNEVTNFLRLVPSGGARHPFELYFAAKNVESLEPGIYRYISSKHAIVFVKKNENLEQQIAEATLGQTFCGNAPLFLLLSVLPYRTVWRYQLPLSLKAITLDAGHIGQNIHLACESLGLGTCMIAAYNQKLMDRLFNLDGEDEFSFYMAPVGHIED